MKARLGWVLSAIVVIATVNALFADRTRSVRPSMTPTTVATHVRSDSDRAVRVIAEPAPAPPAPPCRTSEVQATLVRTHGAVGHDWLSFRLTNTGLEDCRLAGDPLVTARLAGFEPVVATRGVVVAGWPEAGPAVTLPPGESANLGVILNPPCQLRRPSPVPPGLSPATVDLGLPDGVIELAIPDNVADFLRPNGICSFSVPGFERWRPVAR